MPVAQYLKEKLLDHYVGNTALSAPASIYFAAFVSGVEVTGNGYSRKGVTNNTSNFSNASTSSGNTDKVNAVAIEFDQATGSWGTVDEIRAYDASSGGNQLGSATVSQAVGTGQFLRIAAGLFRFRWT